MIHIAVARAGSTARDPLVRLTRAYALWCDALRSPTFPHWRLSIIAAVAMLLPLMLNSGYFSHDEFE